MVSTWNPDKAYQAFSSSQSNTTTGLKPLVGTYSTDANIAAFKKDFRLKDNPTAVILHPGMAIKITPETATPSGIDALIGGGQGFRGNREVDQAFEDDNVYGFITYDRNKPVKIVEDLSSSYRNFTVLTEGGEMFLQAFSDISAGQLLQLADDAVDSDDNIVTALKPLAEGGKVVGIALSSAKANDPVLTKIKFIY